MAQPSYPLDPSSLLNDFRADLPSSIVEVAREDAAALPFGVTIDSPSADGVKLVAFRGTEEVSKPFSFDLEVLLPAGAPTTFADDVLGRTVALTLRGPDQTRTVRGIVAAVATGEIARGEHTARVRLVPAMWRLKKRVHSRVFQDQSVPDVVGTVLREHGLRLRWDLAKDYPAHAYCVQYKETDYAFVRRLLGEAGISFYFPEDDSAAAEGLVAFFDDNGKVPSIAGSPTLVLRRDGGSMEHDEDHVLELRVKRSVRSTSLTLRDYDFTRPMLDLTSQAPAVSPADDATHTGVLSVYDHDGEYEEPEATKEKAALRLEQARRKAGQAEGASVCRRVAAGRRFTLTEHEIEALNQDYVVTRVEHSGHNGVHSGRGDEHVYQNRFSCVPEGVPVRPRKPRRVLRQVMETATVTGPEGSEIHTDRFGRIRILFHWDKESDEARSSCWVRVAQTWAGTGWGFQFVPRVGMEVLVSFVHGDPDRPVVVGCLNNTTHPTPYALPGHATRSGIRTRSVPAEQDGHNELAFEDAAGREEVYLRAQRDLNEEVKRNHACDVGGTRRVTVSSDDTLDVYGHRRVGVMGSLREEVMADRALTVVGPSLEELYDRHDVRIQGAETKDVRGDATRTIGGHASVTVEGDYTIAVGKGDTARAVTTVSGSYVVGATSNVTLMADEAITLRCGNNSIRIDQDGIHLEAASITMKASKSISAKGAGPALTLGDEAQLMAKKVKIYSAEGKLELDEQGAKLTGPQVSLADGDASLTSSEDKKNGKTKKFHVTLADAMRRPYSKRKYHLFVEGKRVEGETDDEGGIEQDVPDEATTVQVLLWIGAFPEGETKKWTFHFAELKPADDVVGAKTRLSNLSYYGGDMDAEKGPDFSGALVWFQKDQGLDETGELDANTVSKLQDVYGH